MIIPLANAPDCDANASLPIVGSSGAKLASRLNREPTVSEIAAEVGADAEELSCALEACSPCDSIYKTASDGEKKEMYLLDKLACGDDGKTLETIKPEYDIPDMYLCEDKAFIESVNTGIKDKNNIENILESMKLLQALYDSSDKKEEIKL